MKVTSVEPGKAYSMPMKNGSVVWAYTFRINGVHRVSGWPTCVKTFTTEGEAKQAMREHVAWQRKRHGLTEQRV